MPEQDSEWDVDRRMVPRSAAAVGCAAVASAGLVDGTFAQAGPADGSAGPAMTTRFTVNGRAVSLDLDPRMSLAQTLQIPPERVHVDTMFVGGGFGSKLRVWDFPITMDKLLPGLPAVA